MCRDISIDFDERIIRSKIRAHSLKPKTYLLILLYLLEPITYHDKLPHCYTHTCMRWTHAHAYSCFIDNDTLKIRKNICIGTIAKWSSNADSRVFSNIFFLTSEIFPRLPVGTMMVCGFSV